MKQKVLPRASLAALGFVMGGFLLLGQTQAQQVPPEEPLVPIDDADATADDPTIDEDTHTHVHMDQTTVTTGTTGVGNYDVERRTEIRRETTTTATPETTTPITDQPDVNVYVEDDDDDDYFNRVGVGLSAGAGVNSFANENLDAITDTGGAWSARLQFGTRAPISLEAAYIGTANRIATLGLDDATLLSNGAEGALLLNLVRAPLTADGAVMLKPYLLAGFAWKHYELTGADFNTSSVRDNDDVYEVPLGGGLALNVDRFLADARFDYRPSLDADLIATDDDSSMQTWTVTGRLGVEF